MKFSRDATEAAFAPREVLGKDAQTLAAELPATEKADFSAVFRKSPMKRAKLARLQRNARVVLANANGDGLGTDSARGS